MISIEEMEAMLDEVAIGLPPDFYKELNGGILVLPEVKYHEKSVAGDLCILGEYHVDGRLGRYIVLYYGSFMQVHGNLSGDRMKEKLNSTLKHEFRHHLESMAGAKDLEEIDAIHIADYMNKYKNKKKNKGE